MSLDKQTIININKNGYYDKYNCKFAFCESCYWFATILVNKFNINHCHNCKKKGYSYRDNFEIANKIIKLYFNYWNLLNEMKL